MKKFTLRLAILFVAMSAWLNCDAQIFENNGLYYEVISPEEKTLVLTYDGDVYYKGDIVVPAKIMIDGEEYSVVEIGNLAFNSCWGLTSITLPEGLQTISSYSFAKCTSLTEITIPSTVTEIRECAFEGCSDLKTVTFGKVTATELMSNVFRDCKALTAVNVDNIQSWFNIQFFNDTSNPVSYAHNLYVGGQLLTDIVIPEGTVKINKYMFHGCESLKNITMPESLETIGEYSFEYCNAIESLEFSKGLKVIEQHAFRDCSNITNLVFNEGIETIGDYSFTGCNGLTELSIPSTVNYLGESAFSRCEGLKVLYTGDNINIIKNYTFQDCKELIDVTIGANTKSIGSNAFSYCTKLANINGGESLISVEPTAFNFTAWLQAQPDGIVYLPNIAYKYKGTMPANSSVEIAEGTKYIADELFYKQVNIESVTLPTSLKTIGKWVFYGCDGLKSVYVPDDVEKIGEFALAYCSSLETVKLGSSLLEVGDGMCDGSEKITNVVCDALVAPFINFSIWGGTEPFVSTVYSNAVLTVPEGSINSYKQNKTWAQFMKIEEGIPSDIQNTESATLKVSANCGSIIIEGYDGYVEVYAVNGQRIYSGYDNVIAVNNDGVYIIRAGENTLKVTML